MRYRKPCDNCGTEFALNTDSPNFVSYPVVVHCPHCNAGNTFTDSRRYAKVPPAGFEHVQDGFILTETIPDGPVAQSQPDELEQSHNYSEVKQDESLPFFVSKQKGETLLCLFEEIHASNSMVAWRVCFCNW